MNLRVFLFIQDGGFRMVTSVQFMQSQLFAFENDVLASTSMSSLMLILGEEANNCSVTKEYCCDLGAEYAFLKFVVMFAFLGFKHSFFTIYNIHSLGLSG